MRNKYAEFLKLLEDHIQIVNRRPVYWFEVRVKFPEKVIKQIKKMQLSEDYLEILAKSLAGTKISNMFLDQGIFQDPYRIYAVKIISMNEDTYEVSLIYC